jgi:hypothetical protein
MAGERRRDIRHSGRIARHAVIRNARLQVAAQRRGQVIDDAAAITETGRPELSRRQRVRLEETRAVDQVDAQFFRIQPGLEFASVIVVAR